MTGIGTIDDDVAGAGDDIAVQLALFGTGGTDRRKYLDVGDLLGRQERHRRRRGNEQHATSFDRVIEPVDRFHGESELS